MLAVDNGGEEERVGLDVRSAAGRARILLKMSKASGNRLRRAQQKRRQALNRRMSGAQATAKMSWTSASAAGRGSGEGSEVGVWRVAEPRARRGPVEEREGKVPSGSREMAKERSDAVKPGRSHVTHTTNCSSGGARTGYHAAAGSGSGGGGGEL
jgi:hypothetical protein